MLVCFSVDCFPKTHTMTWVDKNCDHFFKNFPSLAFGALWSEEQSVKHFKWDFANCLTCPRWGEDQTDEYFPVLWPHTQTPSLRVPAPSLPRLSTANMNSSLKLIAYKGVVTSCFEALKLFFKQKLLKIDDKNSNWWANMIWSIPALLLISPIYNSNFYKCFWKCFNTSLKENIQPHHRHHRRTL